MGQAKYQNDGDPRTSGPGFALTLHPDALAQPYGWGGRRVVFVNCMSDLFHARVPLSFVRQVFEVIADTPQHTYQVLTKRSSRLPRIADKLDWPPNLWMGVSVEDASVMSRVDDLRAVPARGAVPVLRAAARPAATGWTCPASDGSSRAVSQVPATVPSTRPGSPRSAISARRRVPFFFKQWGGRTRKPADASSTGVCGMRSHNWLASAEPDSTFLRDPPGRAHCRPCRRSRSSADRLGSIWPPPPRRLRQQPAAQLLHRDLPGLKTLGHQVEQLVLRRPGA